MSEHFAGEHDDEFTAEIGDIDNPRLARPLRLPSTRLPQTRSMGPALHVRDALRTGAACALVLLTLLGLMSVLPAQLLPGQPDGNSAATGGLGRRLPRSGAIYLLPSVPWGVVRLDGKPLSEAYTLETGHPLILARGSHTLQWGAQPFLPLRCVISVPARSGDTCPLWRSTDASSEPYPVVMLHQSLDALPSEQRQALLAATQSALDASSSAVTLHPGEHYYAPAPGQDGQTLAATELLFGRISYQLALDGSVSEPCDAAPADQPCRFQGQDCLRYCTLPASTALAAGRQVWTAAVDVQATWDYTAFDGTPVTMRVPEPGLGNTLLVLRITWSRSGWHVAPVFGHQAGTPVADDTACASARDWLFEDPETNFFIPSGPFEAAYASGPSPVDGCVAAVAASRGQKGAPSGTALFLEHCGALVAVNSAAQRLWPGLPLAEPSERALAGQLAASLQQASQVMLAP